MRKHTYFGRPDAARGEIGVLQLAKAQSAPAVTLEFMTLGRQISFEPHQGLPANGQTLHVNGVERNYWVEFHRAAAPPP